MTKLGLRLAWAILLLASCGTLTAADTGLIYCAAGESYVYLYQSADNFQVLAQVKCGQRVDIVGPQQVAMMRVKTADGKEGYVPRAALTGVAPGTQAPVPPPEPNATTPQPAPARPPAQAVTRQPLGDSELMALIAGNALGENIVREIKSRGLAFPPTDQYRSLMQTAGADATLMAALNTATVATGRQGAANDASKDQLLRHLATAGNLIRGKQYEQASQELSAALQSGGTGEAGFVMGEALRLQERWPEASALYEEVLRRDPGFLQARTKWSYILYRGGDAEEAFRQARIVLAQDPENAEAHKNAGLALQVMQKFDASENEYKEALRIKPDYALVRYNMGILFYSQGKWDQAILEYKRAIALSADLGDAHNNLGISYEAKGDLDSAIREFREAKRLNPKDFAPRQNLGSALIKRGLPGDAVIELRELEAMAPDSPVCHECLANALYAIGNWDEAAKEYRIAMQLDPSDSTPHLGLGTIAEARNDYDGALAEYRQAERIDPTGATAYRVSGRVLLAKKNPAGAAVELKRAELLNPADLDTHDMYGQALDATGDRAGAIAEYKQAVGLDPKRADVRLRLAAVLEKNQNWAEALDQYRLAAINDLTLHGSAPMRADAQAAYKAARERLEARIAATKASGNSGGAAEMKADMRATLANPSISQKVDEAMLAGSAASQAQRWDEAEKFYKQAADLAEKLQPHDDRLVTSLMHLGGLYHGRKDENLAEATFQRYLKASEELYGAESPQMTQPLQILAMYKLANRDYNSAQDFYQRAVDINVKVFGEGSQPAAMALIGLASVYTEQKAYDKAEAYLLRSLRIDEGLFGRDGLAVGFPLASLCNLYDRWGKPDKAEPCYRQDIAVVAKQYGDDSPVLLDVLTKDAQALRALGRSEEAAKIDERVQSIRAATGAPANLDPNGPPPGGPMPGGPPPGQNR